MVVDDYVGVEYENEGLSGGVEVDEFVVDVFE